LLKAAAGADEYKRIGQDCEAHFYLGEYHLLNSRPDDARTELQTAAQECPKDFREYHAASEELKHLASR
jgi:hypothetical protein